MAWYNYILIYIVLLPFISSAIVGFCRGMVPDNTLLSISIGSMLCTTFLGYTILFFNLIKSSTNSLLLLPFSWISYGPLEVRWSLYYDSVSIIMVVVVTTISLMVHIYSLGYMAEDPNRVRFFSYLSLFTFFMLLLVTSGNLIQLFIGWEGVGLCSYLLIGFWSTRVQANKAAIKALVVNKVGDCALLFAFALLFYYYKSLDFTFLFSAAHCSPLREIQLYWLPSTNVLELVCFALFVGAMAKSAQIGLHTWLPDAMEGPTPVSALIHAATMVTAGVFLIIRCAPLFELAPNASAFVTLIGGLTAFFGASVALVQYDIKKIIAYSTCSQLGYMVLSCGLYNYSAALFHLSTHAFFKSLLFLSAGSVIHALSDEQDIRRMGGLCQLLPVTYAVMGIGSLALIGFPFLSGFYSKDLIIELAWFSSFGTLGGGFGYWIGITVAIMTGYYSIRLFCYTFYGELKGRRPLYFAAHESPITILYPLLFLGCGSIFFGYLTASYYSYLPTLLDQPISGGDFSYCGATSITNTVEGITDSGLVSLKNTFWDKDSRSTLMVSTYNWLVSSLVEGFYLHGLLPSSTGISTYRYTFSGGLWTFMLINLFLVFCYRQYKPYVLRTFCFWFGTGDRPPWYIIRLLLKITWVFLFLLTKPLFLLFTFFTYLRLPGYLNIDFFTIALLLYLIVKFYQIFKSYMLPFRSPLQGDFIHVCSKDLVPLYYCRSSSPCWTPKPPRYTPVRLLELGTVRSGRLCISISDTLKDYFYDYHREFKALLFLLLTGNLVHSEVVLVVYTHLPTIFLNLVSLLLVYFYLVRGSLFHGEAALFSCSWFSTGRYGFLNSGLPSIIHFFTFKWYFDHLYNFFLVNKIFKGSYTAFKYFDKGWLEALGPEGFASFFEKGGYNLSKLQSGYTDTYLFLMVVSSIPIVFTIVMWTFLV